MRHDQCDICKVGTWNDADRKTVSVELEVGGGSSYFDACERCCEKLGWPHPNITYPRRQTNTERVLEKLRVLCNPEGK